MKFVVDMKIQRVPVSAEQSMTWVFFDKIPMFSSRWNAGLYLTLVIGAQVDFISLINLICVRIYSDEWKLAWSQDYTIATSILLANFAFISLWLACFFTLKPKLNVSVREMRAFIRKKTKLFVFIP